MGVFMSRQDKQVGDWLEDVQGADASSSRAPRETRAMLSPTKRQKRGASDMHGVLGLVWGVAEWVGRKRTHEDRAVGCVLSDGATFAGVYDGHAGSKAAAYAASHLHTFVAARAGTLRQRLTSAFDRTERAILQTGITDGTTACVCVVEGTTFTTANVGDSRCVLGGGSRRRPRAVRATTDHKPELVNETRRVQRAGGAVEVRGACTRVVHPGCPLMLATSRTLGDAVCKRHPGLVSPHPDVVSRALTRTDRFAILATDGLWDVVSDEEAVACVNSVLGGCGDVVDADLCEEAAQRCIDKARKKCTMDNVLVLVLCFLWEGDD